jgi:hypothetical protein
MPMLAGAPGKSPFILLNEWTFSNNTILLSLGDLWGLRLLAGTALTGKISFKEEIAFTAAIDWASETVFTTRSAFSEVPLFLRVLGFGVFIRYCYNKTLL